MSDDLLSKINTINHAITHAGPKVVGDHLSANFGKISEVHPKTASSAKPEYKEHVSMHSYDHAVGLAHSYSVVAGLDPTKEQCVFK